MGRISKKGIFLAALVFMVASQAHAQSSGQSNLPPRWNDAVRNSGGNMLALSSRQVFRIYPGDGRIAASRLPLDRLIVCPIGGTGVQITNTDRKGQKIKA